MKRIGRWIKRLFTHPYGACHQEGCDRPRIRWVGFCSVHYGERIRKASREIEEEKFNREANIIAEGIRRAAEKRMSEQ